MRVPIRKSERFTSIKQDPNLTQEKFDELSQKLGRMKKQRPDLAKEVKRLGENGDFSENAEYQIAKGKLRGLNRRIDETGRLLNSAEIISRTQSGVVQLGSTVTVECGNRQLTYAILGSSETNPEKGVISHHSPLGAALLGRRVGDDLTVKLKNREATYRIISIA